MFDFLVYNKFKYRKWSKLSPDERLQVFQDLETIQARKLKRPVCYVEPREMPSNTLGFFSAKENKIFLNTIFFLNVEFRFVGMLTLFHEGRHAFQHYVASSTKNFGPFSKARKWKKNFAGYLSSFENEFAFYAMQPVERDANIYALKRMNSLEHRFRSDRYYHAAVNFQDSTNFEEKILARKNFGMFYSKKIDREIEEKSKNN